MINLNIFSRYCILRRMLPFKSKKVFKNVHKKYECCTIAGFSIKDKSLTPYEISTGRLYNRSDVYQICIYGDECNMPHFHVTDYKLRTICCIRLDKPKFYNHEYIKNNDISNDMIDGIIRTLKFEFPTIECCHTKPYFIYDALVSMWDEDYSTDILSSVNKNINSIPDYNLLKTV